MSAGSDGAPPLAGDLLLGRDAAQAVRLLEDSGRTLDAGQHAAVSALTAPLADGIRGAYLHGGVGRGKTWIVDALTRAAGGALRRRHLHELLGAVNRLSVRRAGSLTQAVREELAGLDLLVLDEFAVHDVADGLLLTRVLEALCAPPPPHAEDVAPTPAMPRVLITSNSAPEDLLEDPEHHHRMLPAIALIRTHLRVVEVGPGEDYRSRPAAGHHDDGATGGFAAGTWTRVGPGDAVTGDGVTGAAQAEAGAGVEVPGVEVPLGSRAVAVLAADAAAGTLEATFDQLCRAPLSVQDHVALARRFPTAWRLRGVPAPADIDEHAFQRLAHVVDVLVDADVALHADAPLDLTWWRRACATHRPRDAERFLSRLGLLRPAG